MMIIDDCVSCFSSLSISVSNDSSDFKKIPSPIKNEGAPIINSHEGLFAIIPSLQQN